MWKKTIEFAKQNQPIATTGIVPHVWCWLTARSGDLWCKNPLFNKDNSAETETVIYFIHGTFDQTEGFQRITERLLNEGLAKNISDLIILSFNRRYRGVSIECFAEQLRDKIIANQHKRVILIGHSRGGLVASYFAEFLAASMPIEVPYVITLGTPFNGSYLATRPISLFSDSVKEMNVSSVFLARLKDQILENSTCKYHFVIASNDFIVPEAFAYIADYVDEHPESLTILKRHGHLSMMSSHYLVSQLSCKLRHYEYSTYYEVSKLEPFTLIKDYFNWNNK